MTGRFTACAYPTVMTFGRFRRPPVPLSANLGSVTLHDELRDLVETFGPGLFRDPDQFRAALDDFLPEQMAIPGQLNVLNDAVRFGSHARCVELVEQGGDPWMAVRTAGDTLARERGTTEVDTSRWAVATLAHAVGRIDRATLDRFVGAPQLPATLPDPTPGPTLDLPTSLPPGPVTAPPPTNPPSASPPIAPPTQPPVPAPGAPPERAPERDEPLPAPTFVPVQAPTESAPPRPVDRPPTAPPGPPRRNPLIVALVVTVSVALLTTAAYAIARRSDDRGERAEDSGGRETQVPQSPSTGETPEVELTAPGRPVVRATPGYRRVVFTLGGPLVEQDDIVVEALVDRKWKRTKNPIGVPTPQGGVEACARVRLVRVDGERRKNGPTVRRCAKSQPRDVELIKTETPCSSFKGAESAGPGCFAYRLRAVGFAPRTDAIMRIVSTLENGELRPCTSDCTKDLRFDADGRIKVYPATGAYDNTVVTVEIDGVRATTAG